MGTFCSRMDFEQLLNLQGTLEGMFFRDELSFAQYELELTSLLSVAGYTQEEYEAAIDKRWDYIDQLRDLSFWVPSGKQLEN